MLEFSTPECTSGQCSIPFSLVQITLIWQEFVDLKQQVNHYRDLWERAREHEQELVATIARMKKEHKAEVDQLKEKIKECNS